MMKAVDESLGRILASLEKAGQLDRTVINLNEKGLVLFVVVIGLKQYKFFWKTKSLFISTFAQVSKTN